MEETPLQRPARKVYGIFRMVSQDGRAAEPTALSLAGIFKPADHAHDHDNSHIHSPHNHSHSHSHSHSHAIVSSRRRDTQDNRPNDADMEKVRSTIKQFVRDWSADVSFL